MRLIRLAYRNVGRGGTRAIVQIMPGEAIRVTLDLARPWTFKPGQHVYLYVPSIGWWTSHPFSVAWSESTEKVTAEKGLVTSRQDVLDMERTSLSLIIRRRTGFTDRLYRKADASPDGQMTVRAVVEGPYGQSIHRLSHHAVTDEGLIRRGRFTSFVWHGHVVRGRDRYHSSGSSRARSVGRIRERYRGRSEGGSGLDHSKSRCVFVSLPPLSASSIARARE